MKWDELIELRIEKGLSQKDVSDLLGTHHSQITHWETGNRTPSIKNLKKLCTALDTTPNVLIGYESLDDDYSNNIIKLLNKLSRGDKRLILQLSRRML